MGVSTDGILVLGIDLGEDLPEFMGDDFDTWLEEQSGINPPNHNDYDNDWPKYWDAMREYKQDFPVDVVRHCSGDYPMYILAVNGTEHKASRGDPVIIDPVNLSFNTIEVEKFIDFCDEHGIDGTPQWLLCSMWW